MSRKNSDRGNNDDVENTTIAVSISVLIAMVTTTTVTTMTTTTRTMSVSIVMATTKDGNNSDVNTNNGSVNGMTCITMTKIIPFCNFTSIFVLSMSS